MGLDNGFLVKSNRRKLTREDLPKIIQYPFESDYGGEPEIIYWRKCWGLRDVVLDLLDKRSKADDVCGIYVFENADQVFEVIKALLPWFDKEHWEEYSNSIWTYSEMENTLKQNVCNLAAIYGFMLQNPDVYLEFYDSY